MHGETGKYCTRLKIRRWRLGSSRYLVVSFAGVIVVNDSRMLSTDVYSEVHSLLPLTTEYRVTEQSRWESGGVNI